MPENELLDNILSIGLIKFEILTSGLRISDNAKIALENSKFPIRTRSGASGGLDLILPHKIYVNAPVNEAFASQSTLILDIDNKESSKLVITRNEEVIVPAELQPKPTYYDLLTSDGIPMVKIGQICSGDRFCYGMTGPYCFFWKEERRCKFCTIGLSKESDASQKKIPQLLESLEKAINDPLLPARHILIGGGTPDGEDMGALLASEICKAIKQKFNISCYVMISAPLKNQYIKLLYDSGADELGMNLELFGEKAWEYYIPGKHKYIGKKRYLEALEYAVKLFGPINTRSIIIVGLEESRFTIEGSEELASMGVMPILSPFRPLVGSYLENKKGFSHLEYWEVYNQINQKIERYQIPTGPTCIACQNNTLALPLPNGRYHAY